MLFKNNRKSFRYNGKQVNKCRIEIESKKKNTAS